MKNTPPHLQALEELERAGIPGLLEVLREEGIDGVRYALWNAFGWKGLGGACFNPREMAKASPSGRYNAYSGMCRACAKAGDAVHQVEVPNSVA